MANGSLPSLKGCAPLHFGVSTGLLSATISLTRAFDDCLGLLRPGNLIYYYSDLENLYPDRRYPSRWHQIRITTEATL